MKLHLRVALLAVAFGESWVTAEVINPWINLWNQSLNQW
jgi:hypothetical protein